MIMTVKKLISELEKIADKYCEIEFLCTGCAHKMYEVNAIKKQGTKVVIFFKDK